MTHHGKKHGGADLRKEGIQGLGPSLSLSCLILSPFPFPP